VTHPGSRCRQTLFKRILVGDPASADGDGKPAATQTSELSEPVCCHYKPHYSYRRGSNRSPLKEVGKIIAAAREPYKTMFWLLVMTGMRAGEMLGLQWHDIDFDRGLMNMRRCAWYGRVQTTKNKNSEAIIPLPNILAATLRAFREQWKSNPDGFLFVTRNRRHPSSNKVMEYGLWPVLDLLAISVVGAMHSDTPTRVCFSTCAQLRRSFNNSYGTQILASLLGSMRTFSGVLIAKPSRESSLGCVRNCSKSEGRSEVYSVAFRRRALGSIPVARSKMPVDAVGLTGFALKTDS
jgi:hypothetical protein